jgi:hypothetical protein
MVIFNSIHSFLNSFLFLGLLGRAAALGRRSRLSCIWNIVVVVWWSYALPAGIDNGNVGLEVKMDALGSQAPIS